MAGNTFQQLLGNPLASPDIIGVTSGASVAAVFGILVLKLNGGTVSLMAVFSGLLVSVLIYFLSQGGGFSNARLILTGIGMQAFLSAVISWMLLKASEYDVANALRWLSGSLNGVKLENVPRLALVVFGAGGAILLLNRQLSMLQLGEAHAVTLGVNGQKDPADTDPSGAPSGSFCHFCDRSGGFRSLSFRPHRHKTFRKRKKRHAYLGSHRKHTGTGI